MKLAIFIWLKKKARALKRELTVLYYAYRHPGTGVLPKVLILVTLGYSLSPIDLIPDFIPVLGYLDDLLIVPLLIALSIRLIPGEVLKECRQKALSQPLRLKKNWFFAAVFIVVWAALLAGTAFSVFRLVRGIFHF